MDINLKGLYTIFDVYVYESVYPESLFINDWQVNKDKNQSQVKNIISLNCFEQFFQLFYPNELPKFVKTQGQKTMKNEKTLVNETVIQTLIFLIHTILNIHPLARTLGSYLLKNIKKY